MLNGTTLESRNQRPASWSTVTSNLSIRTLAAGRTKSWCPKSTGGFSSNFFVTLCVWGSLLVCTRHHKFAQYLMTSNLYVYIYILYKYFWHVSNLSTNLVSTPHISTSLNLNDMAKHETYWNIPGVLWGSGLSQDVDIQEVCVLLAMVGQNHSWELLEWAMTRFQHQKR